MPRTEEEILSTYADPHKKFRVVLNAVALFAATFLFFFVAARALETCYGVVARLRKRNQA